MLHGLAEVAEFRFLDGPVEVSSHVLCPYCLLLLLSSFPFQLPLEEGQAVAVRRWWNASSSSQYDSRDRVLAAAARAWNLWGPFDVVAGFSEGGAVAHLVAIAAANETKCSDTSSNSPHACFASLKAAIFFSAYNPDGAPASSLTLPALHVFGIADTAVASERSSALADMYTSAMRHSHADGHCVPIRAKDVNALRSFLLQISATLVSLRGLLPVAMANHAPEAYDIPPAQAEEQDALASIFDNDYSRVTTNPVQCQITIGWRKISGQSDLVPWIFLFFTMNSQYLRHPPLGHGRPVLRLCTSERNMISEEHESSILTAATQAIVSCGGEPAIFAATSAARDWIDSHFPDGPTSAPVFRVAEHSFTAADGTPVDVQPWWEVEDINLADVSSAGAAAGSTAFVQAAAGKEAGAASFNREWKLIVGLVGKPSSGKSTFFNAACRPSNIESAARMAAHPFTTIEPNIGQAFAALPCPCISASLSHHCSPLHGHAEFPGTRRVPVVVKDVAGLVPGAYQGKGRGNAFLNDLVNCDVLIHVVDASGKTTASGVEGDGDPRHDIDWVVRVPLTSTCALFILCLYSPSPLPQFSVFMFTFTCVWCREPNCMHGYSQIFGQNGGDFADGPYVLFRLLRTKIRYF